jgi:GT2 family glycosyltransferase
MVAPEMEISQGGITFTRMNEVSVIILSWNSLDFLRRFLPSILEHTPADRARLVIADNGSTDGTVDWMRAEYPDIELVAFDHNHGYAGGYHKALENRAERYAILLNSDVEVVPGWLDELVDFMETHPDAGAVAPKILSYENRSDFEYAGAAGGWIDRFGYPFCRGRIFSAIEKDSGQYDEPARIFWASGACLMIRLEAYRKAGGLDPHFFAHMEEIDLCWRLHSTGYEVWFTPSTRIFHVGGGALPNESPRKLYLNFRNNLLLLKKNLPHHKQHRIILMRKILDGVAALQYLMKGKIAFSLSVLRAHRDFSRLWKREYEKYEARVHPHPERIEGWYNQSIVAAFFLAGRRRFSDLNRHR